MSSPASAQTPPPSTRTGRAGPLRAGAPPSAVIWLAAVCGFMTVMDTSIVNVALPAMRAALHLSSADQQWVVDAYLLTLGGFMLIGARAADLFGHRRVLTIGVSLFVAGSLAGGLATDPSMLLGARAVQGLGGAVLAPASLALIIATCADGPARARALAIYQGASALAVTLGVLVGGLLTQELSWRWVMFVNVPVGVGLLLGVRRLLEPAHRGRPGERLDTAGAVMITLAVGALIEGFANAQQHGWSSPATLATLGSGVVLTAVFVVLERRIRQPLVRLDVFRLPGITPGTIVLALNGTVLTGSTLFVSLILQRDLGHGALATGAALLPLVLGSVVAGFAAMELTARFPARALIALGLAIAAAGFCWLGSPGDHPTYAADLLVPLIVVGIGLGLAVVPTTRAAAAAVPPQDAGLASGLFSISRQLGSAVGIAALVTLATARTRSAGGTSTTSALHGDAAALLACAGICAVSALVALLLPRRAVGRT